MFGSDFFHNGWFKTAFLCYQHKSNPCVSTRIQQLTELCKKQILFMWFFERTDNSCYTVTFSSALFRARHVSVLTLEKLASEFPHVWFICSYELGIIYMTAKGSTISTVRPTIHNNPSRKPSFSKNDLQTGEIWKRQLWLSVCGKHFDNGVFSKTMASR